MHIPDGFLATPVWATLDAAAIPAAGVIVHRAQREFDESRVPLLGVMGAFVFAAQMINFPVGVGTTGHLVGGALLSFTLGPAAAGVVMAAILTIQALVFQDGGLLALGPNVLNMAVAGVLAGYLPFHLWGAGPWRKWAIFSGATLSVLVSAVLALAELLISGVRMSVSMLGISLALFLVSALLEGAITLTVIQALEAIQPNFVRRPAEGRSFALGAVGLTAVLLSTVGIMFAATAPDGIERIVQSSPENGYKAGAGLAGVALVYAACFLFGRIITRRRSA